MRRVVGTRRVNGKLCGYAEYRLFAKMAERAGHQDTVQANRGLAHEARRYGITSIKDM